MISTLPPAVVAGELVRLQTRQHVVALTFDGGGNADGAPGVLAVLRRERVTGTFRRSFNLSSTIKTDAIEAAYENGVLTLTLPKAEEAKPRTKAELVELLKSRGEETAAWIDTLSDEFLAEPFTQPQGMTPPTKSRFEMIMSMKEHEMHHRGQLMLIERMLGITPHLTRQMQERFAARQQARA